MKVEIYWNLHKECFSVRDNKTNKVVDHIDNGWIKDAVYVVRQSGRQKVLETEHKNVHAFVKGELMEYTPVAFTGEYVGFTPVGYDPYKYSSFVAFPSREPIDRSEYCQFYIKDGKPVLLAVIENEKRYRN